MPDHAIRAARAQWRETPPTGGAREVTARARDGLCACVLAAAAAAAVLGGGKPVRCDHGAAGEAAQRAEVRPAAKVSRGSRSQAGRGGASRPGPDAALGPGCSERAARAGLPRASCRAGPGRAIQGSRSRRSGPHPHPQSGCTRRPATRRAMRGGGSGAPRLCSKPYYATEAQFIPCLIATLSIKLLKNKNII